MRKTAFILVLAFMLTACSGAVYAQPIYNENVMEDFASGKISISGTARPNEIVGVQLLKEGVSIEEYKKAPEKGKLVIYVSQTAADGSGNYSLEFTPVLDSGNYCVYISAAGMSEPELINFQYTDTSEYGEFISELNSAANFDAAFALISSNKILFGEDTLPLAEGDAYKNAMNAFYTYIKQHPLTQANSAADKQIYNSYVVMYALNAGAISSIKDYRECIYIPNGLGEWLDKIFKDNNSSFDTLLKGKQLKTKEEFEDAMIESAILTTVRYSVGYGDVKRIIEQYKNFIGVSFKPDAVYKRITGKSFTLAELKTELNKDSSSGITGGSGGGSGGSFGGSGGSITYPSNFGSTVSANIPTVETTMQKVDVTFEDIDSVQWANEAIVALCDKGIISRSEEKRFYPNDNVTREQFVKMVTVALSLELDNSATVFSDVAEDAWYKPYVNTAYKNGIINGLGDGTFGSGVNIKRQDIAVMLFNAINVPEELNKIEFKDESDISEYASRAVETLSGIGIINGNENNEFEPHKFATRAEAAVMIYRALKYFK